MKNVTFALVLSSTLFGVVPANAAEQTVTLGVGMGCPTCPYIVKRSLEKVAGVLAVRVSYRDQSAVVTFDDGRTHLTALTQATANVGFPSKPLATN